MNEILAVVQKHFNRIEECGITNDPSEPLEPVQLRLSNSVSSDPDIRNIYYEFHQDVLTTCPYILTTTDPRLIDITEHHVTWLYEFMVRNEPPYKEFPEVYQRDSYKDSYKKALGSIYESWLWAIYEKRWLLQIAPNEPNAAIIQIGSFSSSSSSVSGWDDRSSATAFDAPTRPSGGSLSDFLSNLGDE